MSYDDALREKTNHLTPNAPAVGNDYSTDPVSRDHYLSAANYGHDLEGQGSNLTRTTTGMTLTPEMFERMYLNPKNNVYVLLYMV